MEQKRKVIYVSRLMKGFEVRQACQAFLLGMRDQFILPEEQKKTAALLNRRSRYPNCIISQKRGLR